MWTHIMRTMQAHDHAGDMTHHAHHAGDMTQRAPFVLLLQGGVGSVHDAG